MKVYLEGNNVIIIKDGFTHVISQIHSRFGFVGLSVQISDASNEAIYTDLITNIRNQAGDLIGDETAVLIYLSTFVGALTPRTGIQDVEYITFLDSPYIATNKSVLIVDAVNGEVEIKLPNLADVQTGTTYQVIYEEGDYNVNISTINGTDLIGDETISTLRTIGHSMTVVANNESLTKEYAIAQDSRGITKKEVKIYKASDLTGTLSSDVVYIIDGTITAEFLTINKPAGGLTIGGLGINVSKIVVTGDDNKLLDGAVDGDIFFVGKGLTIEHSGGGTAKVFNMSDTSGNHAIEINSVNFVNCTNLGDLTGFRQGLFRNVFLNNVGDGLTLNGNWNGFSIFSTLVFNHGLGNFFTAAASCIFSGAFRSEANVNLLDSGSIAYDLANGTFNKNSIQLKGGNYNNIGTFCSIPASDPRVKLTDNGAAEDTFIGCEFTISTGATAALTQDVFVKLPGVTTFSNGAWFDDDSGTSARARYIGGTKISVFIQGNFSFSGSNNNLMGVIIRHFNSLGVLKAQSVEFNSTLNGGVSGTRAEGVGFIDIFQNVVEGDYFEPYIVNRTSGNSIDSLVGGNFIVFVR